MVAIDFLAAELGVSDRVLIGPSVLHSVLIARRRRL